MAEPKKSVAAGKAVKAEPEAVPAEMKVEAQAKKEAPDAKETVKAETKAVKKETKATVKKAPVKKAVAKKTTAKAAVEKEEKAEPKGKEKKAAEQTIHFQFAGKSYSTEDFQRMAADVWKYDLHKEEDYKSLELYVKPEENTVYYVFNGDITGSYLI